MKVGMGLGNMYNPEDQISLLMILNCVIDNAMTMTCLVFLQACQIESAIY
jgi:hypothetical protein